MERVRPQSAPAPAAGDAEEQLAQCDARGHALLARGLAAEEAGNVAGTARDFYARAVQLFDRGLALRFASAEARARAAPLQEKIHRKRQMAVDRLLVLPSTVRPHGTVAEAPVAPEKEESLLDKLGNLFAPTHKPHINNDASTTDWVTMDPKPLESKTPQPHRIVNIATGGPSSAPAVARSQTAPAIVKFAGPPQPKSKSSAASVPPPRNGAQATATATAVKNAPELVGVDPAMQRKILDVAVDSSPGVSWDDIAGLEEAKRTLYEIVILPTLRPDLFSGLRQPASGVLLFGPPGCGKTMLAKAVATEAKCAFFSISAASLMSKFLGESEGLVKALFGVARYVAPAVIFIDEIDALLSTRSDKEHEASRRVKTEFLVQWDGLNSNASTEVKRILVMGATNRPQDLDDAAIRRMPQRVYVALPDDKTRYISLHKLMSTTKCSLSEADYAYITNKSQGYSQSDLKSLCQQAAMEPIRELGPAKVLTADAASIRGVQRRDFDVAFRYARTSVDKCSLALYEDWKSRFGM